MRGVARSFWAVVAIVLAVEAFIAVLAIRSVDSDLTCWVSGLKDKLYLHPDCGASVAIVGHRSWIPAVAVLVICAHGAGRSKSDPTSRRHCAAHSRAGELFLEFQPIASLHEVRFDRAEALVRWRHGERGVLQPDDFIPTAEETGLIVPLGRLVLESACGQLRQWREAVPGSSWRVSVNVAATQLREADFPDIVEQALDDEGLDPAALYLELTESTLVEEGIVTEVIGRLRDLGVRISIDDFGTKYSSLSYLTRLSVDELKIDQSFVEGIVGDDSKRAIVSAILAIGKSLDLPVTAEGVETEAQLAELRRLGCDSSRGSISPSRSRLQRASSRFRSHRTCHPAAPCVDVAEPPGAVHPVTRPRPHAPRPSSGPKGPRAPARGRNGRGVRDLGPGLLP